MGCLIAVDCFVVSIGWGVGCGRAGTVFWYRYFLEGGEASGTMNEPEGLRGPTNNFTLMNNASYGEQSSFLSRHCLMTNCLMTNCLMTNCLMTSCLMTNCLMTYRLMTYRLMTNCLMTNCLMTNCLMHGWLWCSLKHLMLPMECH